MPGQIDFLKEHLVKIQIMLGVTRSAVMLEFGKYQTDANFDHTVEMIKIMRAISEFEAEVLGKFAVFLKSDARYNSVQLAKDLETIRQRLETFVYTLKSGPAKDQFINVKPLHEYNI